MELHILCSYVYHLWAVHQNSKKGTIKEPISYVGNPQKAFELYYTPSKNLFKLRNYMQVVIPLLL